MPQVGAWLIATVKAGGWAAFAVKTAASLALQFAVSKITQPTGQKPSEIVNELLSSNAKRMRHLGWVRTSGTVVFWEWTHLRGQPYIPGEDFWGWAKGVRRLYKLLAVADGGMSEVKQWYLDNEPVDVDAEGFVTTPPYNGEAKVRLMFRKGYGDELDGGDWRELREAFPDLWTTDHRLRGIGTILATFNAVDTEDIPGVYPGGDPQVSALIVGAPCQWADDGTTIEGSRNPIVHLSDLTCNPTFGPLSASDIAPLDAERLLCDEPVPTAGGTRPRFQSGISFALSEAMKDVGQRLLDAMGGRAWINADGKLQVEAGVWRAPTVTIQERHIVDMDYGAGMERISRVTRLVPTYVAPQTMWQETNADPVEDARAIARWGEGEPKGIELIPVQHHGQAAHLCHMKLADMNPPTKFTIRVRAFGLRLVGQIRAGLNIPRLGLVNVPFKIKSLAFDGTLWTVELEQEVPEALADITIAEEGQPPAEATTKGHHGSASRTLTIDSVDVVSDDGPPYIRIQGALETERGSSLLAQYRRSDGGVWTNMTDEYDATVGYSFRTPGLADLKSYDVRVMLGRYSNSSGGRDLIIQEGPVMVEAIEVVANGQAPADPVVLAHSGSAGGTLSVVFEPDLGANYFRTGLYRSAAGGTFADASVVKWSYDTSSQVTLAAPIPAAGACFWLRSENESKRTSGPVLVGNYPI